MTAELIDSMVTLEFYAGLATGALVADVVKDIAESRVRGVSGTADVDAEPDRVDVSHDHR